MGIVTCGRPAVLQPGKRPPDQKISPPVLQREFLDSADSLRD